ncbi:hypothetical protein FRC06_004021 [Ceratobasidium sp. 370]|nr:hypothetical protein FRC06_004021 [Ceratobasidium sp. 370]
MKAMLTAASILGFALAVVGVPNQGHISTNAMRSIWGVRGGGLDLAFAPGQTRFAGGDVIRALGKPGPASLGLKPYAPAFHIKGGSLYQLNNETSVLYANVVNVTETTGSHIIPKLQLFLEEKQRGVGGRWKWHDTTLHFEKGEWSNKGRTWLFHSCRNIEGSYGIYVDFNLTQEYPQNCVGITLHSFGDEDNHFN